MIPGIVLAAGASARFAPSHKLLAPYRGKAVVYWSVKAALYSKLNSVLVVVGCRQTEILAALAELVDHPLLKVVPNAEWATGRASSLQAGLSAVPSQAPGALVYPADMPLMSVDLINAVTDAFLRTGALCFPLYNQRKGHPVAFPRSWFQQLASLRDETSAYELILGDWDSAMKLQRMDGRTQCNLNTPQDYRELLESAREAWA